MPSRYYNPRLARSIANSTKQNVLNLADPVEKAFQPFTQLTKEMYNARMKEKQKYDLQKEKIQREQTAFFKDMPVVDPNVLDSSIRDFATKDMFNKQQLYRQAVETLSGYDRVVTTKKIGNDINYWKGINTSLASYQDDYVDRYNPEQEGGSRMSNVNDASMLEIDRRKANKEFNVVEQDGKYLAVFEPQEDSAIEGTIMSDFDAWDKSFIPLERQTKKYVDTLRDFEEMIDVSKRELRWEDDPANLEKLEQKLDSLEFTKDEALSIAVDQLGMAQESYAGVVMQDLDNDGVVGTIDDINIWVKSQLKDNTLKRLTDLRKAYEKNIEAKTDDTKVTAAQIKEMERQNKIASTTNSLLEINFPMDNKGNLNIASSVFSNQLAEAGFSVAGKMLEDGKTGEKFINVRNNFTNETAQISASNLTESDFKRILMELAGDTKQSIDKYFPKSFIGPKEEINLPGFQTPAEEPTQGDGAETSLQF